MVCKLKPRPEDYFKVRYIMGDYPGLFTNGRIYDAVYLKLKHEDGKITTTKRFGVVDEAGDLCYYDNDYFEIVKDE